MIQESYTLLSAMLTSFAITYIVLPSVIDLAYKKNLFDVPDDRKVHTQLIPSLGGIGIFIGVLISFTLFCNVEIFGMYKYIITAYFLLFFMGIKDDLVPMSASIKFGLQIVAAAILTYAGIRITNLHGLFGIEYLNIWFSYALSIFFIVGVTNAFNLIDGIDGLAGGLGGLNCMTLGSLLFWVGDLNFAVLGFVITGSLIAFLKYNFSSYPNKTFMGDAGSLLLGLTVTILSIRFIESPKAFEVLSIVSPIGIVAGIIFIPVFDTLRVFTLRLSRGQSPFSPDKSHIHHELLSSGLNHRAASILLYAGNLVLIANVLFFKSQTGLLLILLSLIAGTVIIQFMIIWRYRHRKSQINNLQDKLNQINEENYLIS